MTSFAAAKAEALRQQKETFYSILLFHPPFRRVGGEPGHDA